MFGPVLATLLVLCAQAAPDLHGLQDQVTSQEQDLFAKFQAFVEKYNKTYPSLEEASHRFQVYQANQALAQQYQEKEQGTAKFGDSPFMDLTPAEFKQQFLPIKFPTDTTPAVPAVLPTDSSNKDLPDKWDWRDKDCVTPVKNQGSCGACWAFSVTGNVECQWKLKSGSLVSLSEQQLLDCNNENMTCNGGLMMSAYGDIIRMGGIDSEEAYPYKENNTEACMAANNKVVAYINDSLQVAQDEDQILRFLHQTGPLSVGMNADTLQFYYGGVHHPPNVLCPIDGLDHAVLLVGYGADPAQPFWTLKNQWGAQWGEQGYFRLYRGDNTCGVRQYVTSSVIH